MLNLLGNSEKIIIEVKVYLFSLNLVVNSKIMLSSFILNLGFEIVYSQIQRGNSNSRVAREVLKLLAQY